MEKQSPHPLLYLSGLKKTTHLLSPSLLSLSLLLSPPVNSMALCIGSLTVNTNKSPTTRKLYLLHHPARFSQKTNNNIPLMTTKYSRTVFVVMMTTDPQHCRVLIWVLRAKSKDKRKGWKWHKRLYKQSLYNLLPLIFTSHLWAGDVLAVGKVFPSTGAHTPHSGAEFFLGLTFRN